MFNFATRALDDGQQDTAIVWLNRSVAAAPDLALAHMLLAQIHGLQGDSARYFAATEHLESSSGRFGVPVARLRSAWSRGGYKATLRELVAASQGRGIAYERALWLAELGDTDGVIRAAEESVARHEIFAPFLARPFRAFAAVQQDPRWASVRKRLGLPAASVP